MTQTNPGRLDPKGRVGMISVPNRGIGAAIARRPRQYGLDLSLAPRPPAGNRYPRGEDHMPHLFEAVDPESPRAWAGASNERFARIDGLLDNNVSGGLP